MKELKIGDKLKDNDPRMPNRALLEIIDLCDGNRITARTGIGAYVKVSVQRIHADGKKRRSGFDLVREDLWRCTVCGRIGTVGRCCGEETREPVRAPNVEFSGDAPLFGAASAGTQGYASGGEE